MALILLFLIFFFYINISEQRDFNRIFFLGKFGDPQSSGDLSEQPGNWHIYREIWRDAFF